jgi:hypothetical protein
MVNTPDKLLLGKLRRALEPTYEIIPPSNSGILRERNFAVNALPKRAEGALTTDAATFYSGRTQNV